MGHDGLKTGSLLTSEDSQIRTWSVGQVGFHPADPLLAACSLGNSGLYRAWGRRKQQSAGGGHEHDPQTLGPFDVNLYWRHEAIHKVSVNLV
jgi:hypothetical protein